MRDKFSILTASYNSDPYLVDWKNSILSQRYRPLEVIFVNDCSSDKTLNTVESFRDDFNQQDIEIKIINNDQRLYCSSSYNRALSISDGMFIGILDSDDMLEHNACEVICDYYHNNPSVCWIYTQHFFCDVGFSKKKKRGISAYPLSHNLLESGAKKQHCFSHWRTLSRRLNNLDGIFPEGLRCAVDKYMGYKLEERGIGGFLDLPLYYYRYGRKHSVVKTEPTIPIWRDMIEQCIEYRKKDNVHVFEIIRL
jgi:glycosyltransferase involved in cell wall biosynthesis